MGSGFSKMKKQAKLMQESLSQAKSQLENKFIEGSAGNGLVKVTLNGGKELKKIAIQPECVSDLEGLQDLILAAFQDASSKIEDPLPDMGPLSHFPF